MEGDKYICNMLNPKKNKNVESYPRIAATSPDSLKMITGEKYY